MTSPVPWMTNVPLGGTVVVGMVVVVVIDVVVVVDGVVVGEVEVVGAARTAGSVSSGIPNWTKPTNKAPVITQPSTTREILERVDTGRQG